MKKITYTEVAKRSGVTTAFVFQIANGMKRPSWKVTKRLVDAVPGTTIELWLDGTPAEIKAALGKDLKQNNCEIPIVS